MRPLLQFTFGLAMLAAAQFVTAEAQDPVEATGPETSARIISALVEALGVR